MSKVDANRALSIYKDFTQQTDYVVQYLSIARQYEHQTRVEVPKLKHAPINLGKQLEDYLTDPEFELNRRQYLKELELKNSRTSSNHTGKRFAAKGDSQMRATSKRSTSEPPRDKVPQPVKGPDPDLIDFFESIEQNRQAVKTQSSYEQQPYQITNSSPFPIQEQQSYQKNGFQPQQLLYQNSDQLQVFGVGVSSQPSLPHTQNNFITHQMNGYPHQGSFQSDGLSATPVNLTSFPQINQQQISNSHTGNKQATNPFRQTINMTPTTNISETQFANPSPVILQAKGHSTNPFAKPIYTPKRDFSLPLDQHFSSMQPQTTSFSPVATGSTNPFAKSVTQNLAPLSQLAGSQPLASGGTNPFRQSQLVNNSASFGPINKQQPIGGGLDNLETIPVFPSTIQQQVWP